MANNIINNIIVLNRGDSYSFDLTIADATNEGNYVLANDDALYLGIMDPNQPFENAVIKKKFTSEDVNGDGTVTIDIKPEDTIDLVPGVYYYSIKLHQVNEAESIDKVFTVINKTKFIVLD